MKLYQVWLVFLSIFLVIGIARLKITGYDYEFGFIIGIFTTIFMIDYDVRTNMLLRTKNWFLGLFKNCFKIH